MAFAGKPDLLARDHADGDLDRHGFRMALVLKVDRLADAGRHFPQRQGHFIDDIRAFHGGRLGSATPAKWSVTAKRKSHAARRGPARRIQIP